MEFPFDKVWDRMCQVTGWSTQTELANYLGIKPSSVSGAKKRGIFPNDWALNIALDHNINISWLLKGDDPVHPSAPTPPETPAPPPPASPLDIKLLQRAIFLVEQEIADGELDPAEKAQGIAEVYEALARVRRNTAATDLAPDRQAETTE